MASLQVKDGDEGDSGLGTISDVTKKSEALTKSVDDQSIATTEVSFQVRNIIIFIRYNYNN